MRKFFVFCCLLLFCCLKLYALEITVNPVITPNTSTIGDILTYKLSVKCSKSIIIATPDLTLKENFTLIKEEHNKTLSEDLVNYDFIYRFSIYETGDLLFPTQNIKYRHKGKNHSSLLPAIPVKIKSILPEDPGKRVLLDIADPFTLRIDKWKYILLSLALVLLSLGLWKLYIFRKNRNNSKDTVMIQDNNNNKTPGELAIEELNALVAQNLLDKNCIKEHYIILTEIMKKYFSKIYHKKILEMTTCETLECLTDHKIDDQTFRRIKKVFEIGDLAKFAKAAPKKEISQEAVSKAFEIINRLTPVKKDSNLTAGGAG
ncbi:MAG: hypothetical protein GY730_06975 [bacterium]|nr:hypothetical protein [bacterium]